MTWSINLQLIRSEHTGAIECPLCLHGASGSCHKEFIAYVKVEAADRLVCCCCAMFLLV